MSIQKKRVVFDGEVRIFENHFGCCTFNIRRENEKKKIQRIEPLFAQKNKWDDDWLRHWFYVRIEMPGIVGDCNPVFPFHAPLGPMDVATGHSAIYKVQGSQGVRGCLPCCFGLDLWARFGGGVSGLQRLARL